MPDYFTDRSSIFVDESVFSDSWTPERLPERDSELSQIGNALSPLLNNGKAHNIFVQGKQGQGKTAATRFMLGELAEKAEQAGVEVSTIFQRCAGLSSSYQLACEIVEQETGTDPNGYRSQKVYKKLYSAIEDLSDNVIVVLDEVDTLGSDDELLNELCRAEDNEFVGDTSVSIIGISNDITYPAQLQPETKDVLCDKRISFDPYDANQLVDILSRRAEHAFVDGAVDRGAITLCAAYAAQNQASARQARDYLYKAGEIAVEQDDDQVLDTHVEKAEERVDRQHVMESIETLPRQQMTAFCAVVEADCRTEDPSSTADIYQIYQEVAAEIGTNSIARRRVLNHLHELETLGVVETHPQIGGEKGGERYHWTIDTDLDTTITVLNNLDRPSEIEWTR